MSAFDELLLRLEEIVSKIDALEDPVRGEVFELLDGIDAMHRMALGRLVDGLDQPTLTRLRGDPAVAWLFDAYGLGVDEVALANAALESVRPYIHSHGGRVDVLSAERGTVRVRLAGACSGCTASAITLRHGIEEGLRENFPGFAALEVEEDRATPHPPPGPTLLQIEPRGGG